MTPNECKEASLRQQCVEHEIPFDSDLPLEDTQALVRKALRRPKHPYPSSSNSGRVLYYEVDLLGIAKTRPNKATLCLVWDKDEAEWHGALAWCSPEDNFVRRTGREVSRCRIGTNQSFAILGSREKPPVGRMLIALALLFPTPSWAGSLSKRASMVGRVLYLEDDCPGLAICRK